MSVDEKGTVSLRAYIIPVNTRSVVVYSYCEYGLSYESSSVIICVCLLKEET